MVAHDAHAVMCFAVGRDVCFALVGRGVCLQEVCGGRGDWWWCVRRGGVEELTHSGLWRNSHTSIVSATVLPRRDPFRARLHRQSQESPRQRRDGVSKERERDRERKRERGRKREKERRREGEERKSVRKVCQHLGCRSLVTEPPQHQSIHNNTELQKKKAATGVLWCPIPAQRHATSFWVARDLCRNI